MTRTILGVDTGLACFGFARVRFDEAGNVLAVRVAVSTTKPPDTSERLRRHFAVTREHAGSVWGTTRDEQPVDLLAVEAVAFLPGKVRWSVVSALGRARQVVDDVGSVERVPVVEVAARSVATAAVDRPGKASKEERILALRARFPLFDDELRYADEQSRVRPALFEHVADAFAVALAASRVPR